MPETRDATSWMAARTIAAELAQTGVDPLDVTAAAAARVALVRRFVLDAILIFGLVALLASIALMVVRAVSGSDPLAGREPWITSAALVLLLAVLVVRAVLPARDAAYEAAWSAFTTRVWPHGVARDDLGGARLVFVRQAARLTAEADGGTFPTSAPGSSR
ncbi:MAG TPA: hypothetical protein VNT53_09920 [Pseudolysinimonas sp.]|nr:hypothetical protein [Pseudolysinimonas sp.]